MKRMLALAFVHQQKEYSALVRVKEYTPNIILRVTIMNGNLEQLLFGYNLFQYKNKEVIPVNCSSVPAIASLQQTISDHLRKHLHTNPELIGNPFFTTFS